MCAVLWGTGSGRLNSNMHCGGNDGAASVDGGRGASYELSAPVFRAASLAACLHASAAEKNGDNG